MEKLKNKQVHYTNEVKYPGSLKTAQQISENIQISKDRILELAEGHYMPHWRIDGKEPLFQLAEVKEWVAKNLLDRIEGSQLPISLKVMVQPPDASDAPEAIKDIKNLKEIPIGDYPPGVYFLTFENKIVYIGQSVSPVSRISQHTDKNFTRAYMVPVPRTALDNVEGALIRLLNPPLNSGDRKIAIGPGDKNLDSSSIMKYAEGVRT